jgi:hypothetical protein
MPENQGTQVNKNIAQELLGELAHGTHNAHFEVRGDGIYRGDRLIIPIVVEYVNVIDDVGGPRYVVRFKVTAPPLELTCDGDLDEVYECVKSHVYVLESHVARNALMYALFKWTREHDSPEQPQTKVAAMDAFRELVNKILSTAQQVYARLKPSNIEAPGSPYELFNIIQAHPAVLEVIQTVAYGSKVTIDGMLCIPIETLKNKGINVDELPMVDYQELTEVMKSGEFWDTLRQLNINTNTTDAQQLSRLLRPSIHQHVNANDRVTKAIKALTGEAPVRRKVKTPQGRVLWAVCTTPPEAIDNDQQNNGSETRTETHSDKALVAVSSATVGATVPATVGSTVNQGESTGQGDTQRSRWLGLVSNDLAVELANRLRLPVDVVEGFLSFLVNHYLVRYPSVSVLRFAVDLLSMSGDVRVSGFLNALGVGSGVRPTLEDPSFNRLYNAVATVVRLLDKAGLVAYNSAMGVVDVVGCGG